MATQEAQRAFSNLIKNADFSRRAALMAAAQKAPLLQLEKEVEHFKLHQRLQKHLREDLPAVEKIRVTLQQLARMRAAGMSWLDIETLIKSRRMQTEQGTGVITGQVTVAGAPPTAEIEVLAFDRYGFLAGSAMVEPYITVPYRIEGLPAGDYYVVTQSNFVDEFYNDVILNDFRNWRSATLVSVTEGAETSGIDFDLALGARVQGHVYMADGTTPLPMMPISFTVTWADSPEEIASPWAVTGMTGEYEITIPVTGRVKIAAMAFGFRPEFYNNKATWEEADPITISSLTDVITGIDFSLEPGDMMMFRFGAFSGAVRAADGVTPVPFAVVVAFNLTDSTVAGVGLSDETGAYVVAPLDSGEYIAFANDFLGPYVGEYYQDASTPAEATPFVVTPTDTIAGIDFTLDLGGLIAGQITGPTGNPLDSVFVVALRFDGDDFDPFFFSRIDLGVGVTDSSGQYAIAGLTTGEYVVRTLSLLNPKYRGLLDEYYENVYSIYNFDQATRVPVTAPNPTTGINFQLEMGGSIAGQVTASDGVTPVTESVTILALNAQTLLPELTFAEVGDDGSYQLPSLPTGSYLLLAVVDAEGDTSYLSEFYDGARSVWEATPVPVQMPEVTSDINFTLDRGGIIQGFVYLSPGFPAGADTLWEFPVVVYDSQTGQVVGSSEVTFSGGYRVGRVPPGNYKIAAIPGFYYGVTYAGGGDTFDDPASSVIPLTEAQILDVDITLEPAAGVISGMLTDEETGEPMNNCLVLAYDGTGHVVSLGLSGIENTDGLYLIGGLRTGAYFVRTWSVFSMLMDLEDMEQMFGGGMGIPTFEFQFYQDEWYDNVPIPIDVRNLLGSLLNMVLGGEREVPFVPFYSMPIRGASTVNVTSPGLTSGINFALAPLSPEAFTGVPPEVSETLPVEFRLFQNFPNPFNPATVIQYELPKAGQVRLEIYNALGRKIRTLVEGPQQAGTYRVVWDGTDDSGNQMPSGIYLYRLTLDQIVNTRRMVLVR